MKKDIHKIYFDMDGVVADFDRGVLELCHMFPLEQELSTPEENDRLYEKMREVDHFYGNLKALPTGVVLFWELYRRYGKKVGILSGIPKPKRGITDAKDDKIEWCGTFLPDNIEINIVYREEKPDFCKGPDDYLVDDFSRNIEEWENSGGTGIYCMDVYDAIKQLRELGLIEKKRPVITGEDNIIEQAERLANLAHEGQKDKSGTPYIFHPVVVASFMDTAVEKAVAYMHDVLEDTFVDENEIRELFGDEITDILILLRHEKSVPYLDYIRNLKRNPIARKVKLADLYHNMQIDRIPEPTVKDFERLEKYQQAVEILNS